MYLSYYHLRHNPFQISTDPRFLWMGEKHEEGLATLQYGVQENKGFLLLTGDVGTGKTTLVNALLRSLEKETLVATIRDPNLEPLDFYNYLAHVFGMESEFRRKGTFLIHFERLLHRMYAAGRKVVLIIDEAQRITQQLLEEVRLLSNIEREDSKLLNIFFVGQIEFHEILLRPENRAIRQRITVSYTILPLSEQETGHYIRHRLRIAATEKSSRARPDSAPSVDRIFSAEAVREIYLHSKGYPRLINIICDRSLLTGYVEDARTISAGTIRECIAELAIPEIVPFKSSTDPQPNADKSGSTNSRNPQSGFSRYARALAATALLISLFAAGYISRTPAWFSNLTDFRAGGYVQDFKQLTDGWFDGEAPAEKQTKRTNLESSGPTPARTKEKIQEEKQQQQLPAKPSSGGRISNETAAGEQNQTVPAKEPPGPDPAIPYEPLAERQASIPPAPFQPDKRYSQPEEDTAEAASPPAAGVKPEKNQQAAVREIQMKPLLSFEKLTIPFPTDSNFPPPESLEKLNLLIETLQFRPQFNIRINGYTDSLGYESYNQKLSEFRANSIKSYMVGKGLPESRILARGFGSHHPIATNDTESGRRANRRVEVEIVP